MVNSCAHDEMCTAENADDVKMNCVIVMLIYESIRWLGLKWLPADFWDKILKVRREKEGEEFSFLIKFTT